MLQKTENPKALQSQGASKNIFEVDAVEYKTNKPVGDQKQAVISANGVVHKQQKGIWCDGRRTLNEAVLLTAKNSLQPSPQPKFRALPPLDVLREYFDVDPKIGEPINLKARPHLSVGAICGTRNSQYITVYVKGVPWRWHRIAFKLYHGHDPIGLIDHASGDKRDNRKCNLREVSYLENNQNRHVIKSNSGVLGVSKEAATGMWLAAISSSNRSINLGRYRSKECAVAARKHAESILFEMRGAA